MDYNQYKTDFENATHWIPMYDNEHDGFAKVVLGKPYVIFTSEWDGERCILEDDGAECPTFIYHEGYFVKLPHA